MEASDSGVVNNDVVEAAMPQNCQISKVCESSVIREEDTLESEASNDHEAELQSKVVEFDELHIGFTNDDGGDVCVQK